MPNFLAMIGYSMPLSKVLLKNTDFDGHYWLFSIISQNSCQ